MSTIDTLKLARRLEEHGFERKQAEGLALEMDEAIAMTLKDLATKHDIERMSAELRASIAESRNTQVAWTVASVLALAGIVIAGARLIG